MNNIITKVIIIALALVLAVGAVLYFLRTIVRPPENIRVENVHSSDIIQLSDSYHPDTMILLDAEKMFDMIVDRADLYKNDELIDQGTYDKAISTAAIELSSAFVHWSKSKFQQSVWQKSEHLEMKRIISKLRNITVEDGSKKALDENSLSSLTDIEDIIAKYNLAWSLARNTTFKDYDDASLKCKKAKGFASNPYLKNCKMLANALNDLDKNLENSCYRQLYQETEKLQYFHNFENRKAYEAESKRLYNMIRAFKETNAFGISTESHAKTLAGIQDKYDRMAEDYEWAEDNNTINNYH